MHGLPDRPGLDVVLLQRQHNIQGLHPARKGDAREPVVGFVPIVHRHKVDAAQGAEFALIKLKYLFFLSQPPVQHLQLPPANAGHDIAHAVVVADLTVLIVTGRVSGLGGPEANFLDPLFVVGKQDAAAGGGDDLVAVEGENGIFAEGARGPALVQGAQAFGGVFDQDLVIFPAQLYNGVHVGGQSIEVDYQHGFGPGIAL